MIIQSGKENRNSVNKYGNMLNLSNNWVSLIIRTVRYHFTLTKLTKLLLIIFSVGKNMEQQNSYTLAII